MSAILAVSGLVSALRVFVRPGGPGGRPGGSGDPGGSFRQGAETLRSAFLPPPGETALLGDVGRGLGDGVRGRPQVLQVLADPDQVVVQVGGVIV